MNAPWHSPLVEAAGLVALGILRVEERPLGDVVIDTRRAGQGVPLLVLGLLVAEVERGRVALAEEEQQVRVLRAHDLLLVDRVAQAAGEPQAVGDAIGALREAGDGFAFLRQPEAEKRRRGVGDVRGDGAGQDVVGTRLRDCALDVREQLIERQQRLRQVEGIRPVGVGEAGEQLHILADAGQPDGRIELGVVVEIEGADQPVHLLVKRGAGDVELLRPLRVALAQRVEHHLRRREAGGILVELKAAAPVRRDRLDVHRANVPFHRRAQAACLHIIAAGDAVGELQAVVRRRRDRPGLGEHVQVLGDAAAVEGRDVLGRQEAGHGLEEGGRLREDAERQFRRHHQVQRSGDRRNRVGGDEHVGVGAELLLIVAAQRDPEVLAGIELEGAADIPLLVVVFLLVEREVLAIAAVAVVVAADPVGDLVVDDRAGEAAVDGGAVIVADDAGEVQLRVV